MLEEDSIESLIHTLQLAKTLGYSSSSSPIGYLLEAGTDVCLQIAALLKKGTQDRKNNPEVKFNYRVSDSLGNPKSFKVVTPSKTFWDPQLSKYFTQLASFFIKVKRGEDALDFMSKQFPTCSASKELTKELDEKAAGIQVEIGKIANIAYHRRQKKKRSVSKYH